MENNGSIKVGDVFYTSWGYDQTNYEYIVIVGFSKSGKTAICQRAKADTVEQTQTANIQRPTKQPFGDKFHMRIYRYDKETILRGSYPYCGDGKIKTGTRLDSFYQTDGKETFYETAPCCGH